MTQNNTDALLDPTHHPHVLLVCDDVEKSLWLERYLRKRHSYALFTTATKALNYLAHNPADVIIADFTLPDMNGISFLMSAGNLQPDAGQIIILGNAELESSLSAIHQARIDYTLALPMRANELLQTIEKLWKHKLLRRERDLLIQQNQNMMMQLEELKAAMDSDVSGRIQALTEHNQHLTQVMNEFRHKNAELLRINESLTILSTVDPLTGLYNRRALYQHLQQHWSHFQRHQTSLSLIMADIDLFKRVNDQHGHDCGDKVLKHVAALIRINLREGDVACRYGGEEMVIILPQTAMEAAFLVADKIRIAVANNRFTCKKIPIPITISLGVASAQEQGLQTMEELIQMADQSMYRAKQEGRNRTVLLESPTQPHILRMAGE